MFVLDLALFTYFGQFLVFLTPSQGLAQILATGKLNCWTCLLHVFVAIVLAIFQEDFTGTKYADMISHLCALGCSCANPVEHFQWLHAAISDGKLLRQFLCLHSATASFPAMSMALIS